MSDNFEKRTREVLEESTSRLDGRTQSRLTQARHAALGQLERPARARWGLFVPAGAAAAVAVLVVSMWPGHQDPSRLATESTTPADDMELIADAPDFISDSEDLEFYEWAAGELES